MLTRYHVQGLTFTFSNVHASENPPSNVLEATRLDILKDQTLRSTIPLWFWRYANDDLFVAHVAQDIGHVGQWIHFVELAAFDQAVIDGRSFARTF